MSIGLVPFMVIGWPSGVSAPLAVDVASINSGTMLLRRLEAVVQSLGRS